MKAAYIGTLSSFGLVVRKMAQHRGTFPPPALNRTLSKYIPPAYVWVTLIAIISRLPTLSNKLGFIDEAAYLAQARLVESFDAFIHSVQYRTETKPPLGILPYILADLINRPNAIFLVRVFGLLAVLVTVWLLVALSRRLYETPLPGVGASALWCLFLLSDSFTVAPLLEYFQAPFILGAVLLTLYAVPYKQKTFLYLSLSGLFLSIAALIKPPALILLPVFVVVIFVYLRPDWRRVILAIVVFGFGAALPICLYLVPYVIRPDLLPELRYNYVDVAALYSNISQDSLFSRGGVLLFLMGLLNLLLILFYSLSYVVHTLFHGWTWDDIAAAHAILWSFGVALLCGYLVGQTKESYVIPVLPFLLLFVGYQLMETLKQLRSRRANLAFLILLLIIGELPAVRTYVDLLIHPGESYAAEISKVDETAIVAYITSHSTPNDSLWVYYNAPELYWYSDRKPATNEPVGTFLVDIQEPNMFERAYSQLQRDKPAVIVDILTPRFPREHALPMMDLPLIGPMITQDYACDATLIANVIVCIRHP